RWIRRGGMRRPRAVGRGTRIRSGSARRLLKSRLLAERNPCRCEKGGSASLSCGLGGRRFLPGRAGVGVGGPGPGGEVRQDDRLPEESGASAMAEAADDGSVRGAAAGPVLGAGASHPKPLARRSPTGDPESLIPEDGGRRPANVTNRSQSR